MLSKVMLCALVGSMAAASPINFRSFFDDSIVIHDVPVKMAPSRDDTIVIHDVPVANFSDDTIVIHDVPVRASTET
ncbi:Uu.00g096320.m01.CDS01 [Anthostomella pinea]|uniref:Uu.00g096320.m01.CDS01 n=1 Tax=Anthostomella pinea TaxID=933095 RepID=A0AAI8V758_9PEZI|nr:Uu.00g096320.m01.CDS01 [Anthostomella pinea]